MTASPEPRSAGVPPASLPSVSLGDRPRGETPLELAAEDGCATGLMAPLHGAGIKAASAVPQPGTGGWSPSILAFFCNWCTYTAADLAGVSRMKYASNIRVIRLMCSGRVDPQFVLDAFSKGADGVLIGGCHPNDCHYAEGNYKCLRRFRLLKRMVGAMGIEEQRLRLEWISAAEGDKVRQVVNEMVEQLRELGPLGLPSRMAGWDAELAHAEPPPQPQHQESEVAHA